MKHGATKNHSMTRLYRIWACMKTRVRNPNRKQYSDYGGRGITICPEWEHDFSTFENPKKYVERHGLDTPPYEEFYGCPICGGAFEESDEESEEEEIDDECDGD